MAGFARMFSDKDTTYSRPDYVSRLIKYRAMLCLCAITPVIGAFLLMLGCGRPRERQDQSKPTINPAAWGNGHVGQHVPDYVTGDECLFCHRTKIGPEFSTNPHNLTIRPIDEAPE